jgi:hypothetical protein
MTVVVKCDQPVGVMDVEEKSRADHQQPDPEDAAKYRHEEPVAEIGDQFALAPPGFAGIAGPEMRDHGEHHGECDRNRNDFRHRLAHHHDDF